MAVHCVAVVDPISTGANVAAEVASRGYALAAVWTKDISDDFKAHVPESCKNVKYVAEVREQHIVKDTAAALRLAVGELELVACIVGGESGVTLADFLSEELGLRTNGTAVPQRRDKKVQQELVKARGLRSVRQAGGTRWVDVSAFVESEPMPVVVKPVESAGSDGVKLCHSKEEVEEHFKLLMTAQHKVGVQGAAVLVQEFLHGSEYVVDHVSCSGVHKTTMVWTYDKRPVNGAAFVYYGMLPVPSDSPEARLIIPYVRDVLDAMKIQFGPTHGEVMLTESGPCLVEMNCRVHGGDGAWMPLAAALTGYTQVECGIDTFLDEDAFGALPDLPPSPFKVSGQEVDFVSLAEGRVIGTPGYDRVRAMDSFVSLETSIGIGSEVVPSVDMFSMAGCAILMNADAAALQRDIDVIREMELSCTLFDFEEGTAALPRPRIHAEPPPTCQGPGGEGLTAETPQDPVSSEDLAARDAPVSAVVAVVDPFSTGACVAHEAAMRGYAVVAVWTRNMQDEIKARLPEMCRGLKYLAEVQEQATVKDTASALRSAVGRLQLAACIVGGDSGVTLADFLSEELGLQTNGTAVPQRRDKEIQQNLVGASGLRAVRQAAGTRWENVQAFVESEPMPLVVKPVESAGSDGVKLCHTKEEVEEHFRILMTAQRKVGSQGASVVVQEFLQGREYVVDHVSLDGVHKTTMVWCYDKRPANGAQFVYYGMVPVPMDSPEAGVLIAYVRGVLDALCIRHGPTHGEVIITQTGPCLVEMNCRAHGGNGVWMPLARALTGGYTMLDAGLDAFLNESAFHELPDRPPCPFKASGQNVMLVSMAEGTVVATPGYDRIRAMPSFVSLETDNIGIGSHVTPTVDLFSAAGQAIFMHQDPEVVRRDIDEIRRMETDRTLFEFEERPSSLGPPRAESTLLPCYEDVTEYAGSFCTVI